MLRGFFGSAAIAAALLLAACEDKAEKAEAGRCGDTLTAYLMTTSLIKQRLPENFPYFPDRPEISVLPLEGCKHQVTAYYTAKDALGRIVRHDYVAMMRYSGNNYWELVEFEVQNSSTQGAQRQQHQPATD